MRNGGGASGCARQHEASKLNKIFKLKEGVNGGTQLALANSERGKL